MNRRFSLATLLLLGMSLAAKTRPLTRRRSSRIGRGNPACGAGIGPHGQHHRAQHQLHHRRGGPAGSRRAPRLLRVPAAVRRRDAGRADTLTVEYGQASEVCLYRGQVITGSHAVTIEQNDQGQVLVGHVWTELSNQVVTVSGTANVTWQGGGDPSRHVEHALTWTRLRDGRTGTGTANLTPAPARRRHRGGLHRGGVARLVR